VKFDRTGIVWSRAHALCPDPIDCHAWSIFPTAITRAGDGFAVCGSARVGHEGNIGPFVAMLSAAGDLLWIRSYATSSGADIVNLRGIVDATPDGGPFRLLILGELPSRAFTFQIDGAGHVTGATHSYRGMGVSPTVPRRLRATPNEGIFLLGETADPNAPPQTNPARAWIVNLQPDGTPVWEKTYGESGRSMPSDIAEGTQSLMVVGGDGGGFVPGLVLNLEKKAGGSPGRVRWAARPTPELTLRSIVSERFVVLSATASTGEVHDLTGVEYEYSWFVLGGAVSIEGWLAQIDEDGRFLWQKIYDRALPRFVVERAIWHRINDVVAVGPASTGNRDAFVAYSGGMPRVGVDWCGTESHVTLERVGVIAFDGPALADPIAIVDFPWATVRRRDPLLEIVCGGGAAG